MVAPSSFGDLRSLPELFDAQAARTPDAVALELESKQLTYRELKERADALARCLAARGVGPEVMVGVYLERSLDLPVALLAVLKAGGAYVPVDPASPKERIAWMFDDAQVALVLSVRRLAPALSPGLATLLLDGGWEAGPAASPRGPIRPGTAAYVIYTSGSTGRPKGVVVTHASLANHAVQTAAAYQLTGADRVLQVASPAFDAAVEELFPSWVAGAAVVMAPAQALDLAPLVRSEQLTVVNVFTGLWNEWLAQLLAGGEVPACVRLVVIGTEAARSERLAQWLQQVGPRPPILNAYGPTEATVTTTLYRVDHQAPPQTVVVPIGRAHAGAILRVLDDALCAVPDGQPGELCIGGVVLARGYLGKPDLTAERFVPDPFGAPGSRLYRTGDRVRWLSGGDLEFCGRADFQVKVRGFRIELGEVESALMAQPGVREAVVVAREDRPGETRLAAYLVAQDGATLGAETLREGLKKSLPDYMVPASIKVLGQLPRAPSGKLDRQALPAPEWDAGTAYVPPDSPVEATLCAMWADMLGHPRVGVTDDFFALGGHSLTAVRALSRIKKKFGVSLDASVMFKARTVRALATQIEAGQQAGKPAPGLAPKRVSRAGPLELSHAQQRLWALDRLRPGLAAYNVCGVWRIEGQLDTTALGQALNASVERHEAWRTTFGAVDGVPTQVIHPHRAIALPVIDLTGVAPEAREEEAARQVAEETQRPFDLEAGPLLRTQLVQLDQTTHLLVMTMHHIISDGWTMGVLGEELAVSYAALLRGERPPLTPLSLQYVDYTAWQKEWLEGPDAKRQLDYWVGRLRGVEPLGLATDFPRPPELSQRGARLPFTLTTEVTAALNRLSTAEGATANMVLLAGLVALLHRYTGQQDICVGSPAAGRSRAEWEGLAGFFVNTLVLRTPVEGGLTFRQLVQRARQTALEAYSNQELPFNKVVEALNPVRSLDRNPLFQVMLSFPDMDLQSLTLTGQRVTPIRPDVPTELFDLSLFAAEHEGAISGRLSYSTDLFEAATIERMCCHLERLLGHALQSPDTRVADLPLLSEAERRRQLWEWNATATDYPKDQSVHALFEEQARRAPEAIAVESGAVRVTYAQLEGRANALAQRLCSAGVKPGALVGLCVERSVDLVVGMLGILKTGAAYVPLDPDYPPDRLALMIKDASPAAIATTPQLAEGLSGAPLVTIDPHAQEARGPGVRAPPNALAYVMYTSGSTGTPKGVAIEHRSVVRLVRQTNYVSLQSDDCVGQVSNASFDAATFEIWGALLNGGRLALISREQLLDSHELEQALARHEVTAVFLTTSFFNLVARERPAAFSRLKYLFFGGERADPECISRVLNASPPRHLCHVYGPTETTTFATWFELPRVDRCPPGPPIGGPLANDRIYVLDGRLNPVPLGAEGELYIGGDGVGRGYWNRPDQTAERFVPDPFSPTPGARMYRTGDIVRQDASGPVTFVGRRDLQVKIRGFRVEVGEVEKALCELKGVEAAVVVAHDEAEGTRRLVGYVVGGGTPRPAAEELRQRLKQVLPDYMVPSLLIMLEALPLTPNGKVDHKALPRPTATAQTAAYLAPRTPAEEVVAATYAEVLKLPRVGALDNFFDLGGHSLLAVKVVTMLQRRLDIDLPVRSIFKFPVVADLAEAVWQTHLSQIDPAELETAMTEIAPTAGRAPDPAKSS